MSNSAHRRLEKFIRNRFFHDGVRLQSGRVVSAISQLRALAGLYEDCYRHGDTSRETDHADQLAPKGRQRCSSSGGSRRWRPGEQQQPQQPTKPKSNQPSVQMLPARILLAYDSCLTESKPSGRCHGAGRRDESSSAAMRKESLATDEGILNLGQRSRHCSSGTAVSDRREGGHGEPIIREGGRRGVQVRVVGFRPDRGEGSQGEQNVCRGIVQVGGGFSSCA